MRTTLLPLATLILLARAESSSSSSATSASTTSTATTGIPATYTHDIKIGANGLSIEPDTLIASPGDLLNFHFYASNHSIAQSSYDKPCEPLDGGNGIYSGFFAGQSGKDENGQIFSMRLNGTDPVWLYCSAGEHCKGGLSMVVNAPANSDQTLKGYREKAKKVDVKSPTSVYGGVVRSQTSALNTPSATKKSAAVKIGGAASTVGLMAGVAAAMFML